MGKGEQGEALALQCTFRVHHQRVMWSVHGEVWDLVDRVVANVADGGGGSHSACT